MPVLESRLVGLGHDVVDVAAFERQLTEPGSRVLGLFSERERRQAAARARVKHDGEAVHLAAKWAGKEAVLKAWCEALDDRPYPYTVDDFPWAQVEILDDSRSRPRVVLGEECASAVRGSLRPSGRHEVADVCGTGPCDVSDAPDRDEVSEPLPCWHISLSHDGPVASAVVVLTVGSAVRP
ncbi:holo-[acyl-carrier protein] synthase [Bifidobacterium bohemicum]|uniref:Holo-[acyl-carrier-protein] synthase n=1 Tax=Bifidobacterium bohemicum DSM 22767 TaxID=1437606 RepID=A0A086ZER6_9BIFI|nr:4'-phosphopantetheinyl transferase superfamily protein [Bifidobacterium bohemicum]KFI45016.1 4'-phosphopantetheinyl transferase [Bifidobacterium bohemicum DSM 22767]SCB93745.1 holo-[acyl-carrier protein] synthase [Bifidobacterium bohemicum]